MLGFRAWRRRNLSRELGQRHIVLGQSVALALGAMAVGALAFGALAIGAVAVGRLMIGRARVRRIEIDDLVIHRLTLPDRERDAT
jgi:hypothetical protein